jgi:hypothetical protein
MTTLLCFFSLFNIAQKLKNLKFIDTDTGKMVRLKSRLADFRYQPI